MGVYYQDDHLTSTEILTVEIKQCCDSLILYKIVTASLYWDGILNAYIAKYYIASYKISIIALKHQ